MSSSNNIVSGRSQRVPADQFTAERGQHQPQFSATEAAVHHGSGAILFLDRQTLQCPVSIASGVNEHGFLSCEDGSLSSVEALSYDRRKPIPDWPAQRRSRLDL